MTDEECVIKEDKCNRSGGPDDIALGSLRAALLRALNDGARIREASEIPSKKMKTISTVNFMVGKLEVAQDILDDVGGYNPRMEDYLGRDAREEFDDALLRARKAVREALTMLYKEVREHNRMLDPWKEEKE